MRGSAYLAIALLLTACSSSGAATNTPPSHPSFVAVGCTGFPLLSGTVPKWIDDADGDNSPTGVPYVIASPQIAAAFLFGNPLRAGHPVDPANKILWVVAKPRNGSDLQISASPAGAISPVVTLAAPPDSGPGEIYPSIVEVPSSGCWDFTLRWAGNTTRVDLAYA